MKTRVAPTASAAWHPDYPRNQVWAGVLAGGQGSRMAGADKGLVELAGRPMMAHVLDALRPQVGHVLISANRNLTRYRAFGHAVLPDPDPGFAGPLAGMAALLAASSAPWLLVVPCDSPALPRDLAPRLWRAARETGANAAVVQVHGHLQPVFALLSGALRAPLQADLAAGARGVGAWLREQDVVAVDFSARADAFVNVNTRADRDRLARVLGGHPTARCRETP